MVKPDFKCKICDIFSNPNRIALLLAIKKGPKTVSELIKITKLPQAVISQHFSIMRNKGILETKREGSFISYRLKYPELMDAFDIMKKITKKMRGK